MGWVARSNINKRKNILIFSSKVTNIIILVTKKNLTKLDDKHLKDINKSHCVDLFETLKSAYENTDDEQVIRNWALEAEVKFY